MKKLVIMIMALALAVLISCGSSQEEQAATSKPDTEAAIDWVRFDEGLEAAAGNGKHVLAYFWRDN